MHLVNHQEVSFFQFAALNRFEGLLHAVTCRDGGISPPPCDSLNLSPGGDAPGAVSANRERLRQLTGGGIHVYTHQNHGTSIRIVTRDVENGGDAIQAAPAAADVLITNVPGIRLLIQTADCQAVMLFDPRRRVVANIHCGWRGSVADIISRTVRQMVVRFGCEPGQVVAAIGPSLGPCCAEFVNYENEIPPHLWPFRVGMTHFDFWQISRHQLITAGLADDHVHTSGICTRCNSHLFFSYRAAHKTGRFAALIGMNHANGQRNGRPRSHSRFSQELTV